MFHQRDGLFAERLADGSVRLIKRNPTVMTRGELVMDHTIPPNEWASLVASDAAALRLAPDVVLPAGEIRAAVEEILCDFWPEAADSSTEAPDA